MTTSPETVVLRKVHHEEVSPSQGSGTSHLASTAGRLDAPVRLALSVTEAAELLGISRALAYELVARGELPSVRLGRRVVVPRVALLAMFGNPGPEAG